MVSSISFSCPFRCYCHKTSKARDLGHHELLILTRTVMLSRLYQSFLRKCTLKYLTETDTETGRHELQENTHSMQTESRKKRLPFTRVLGGTNLIRGKEANIIISSLKRRILRVLACPHQTTEQANKQKCYGSCNFTCCRH